MKIEIKERPWDLLITIILASIQVIVIIIIPDSPLRILLGLLFVLFIPGYAIVSAIFPKERDINAIGRIILSFGVSVVVIPLIGLLLNYTPLGIKFEPIITILYLFVFIVTGIAYYRRIKTPISERFFIVIEILLPKQKPSFIDKLFVIIIIGLIISSFIIVYYLVNFPKEKENFTEFYILGPKGKEQDYPNNITIYGNRSVIIGLINHEGTQTDYMVEIALLTLNNTNINSTSYFDNWNISHTLTQNHGIYTNITLNPEEISEHNFTFRFNVSAIGFYKLQFLLYKLSNSKVPFRDIYLWLKVIF